MDIKIPVSRLQDIVNKISVITKPNTDDVTSMMLIDATGEKVRFCGTNISTRISISCDECEIEEKGKTLLKLSDIKSYVGKFAQLSEGYGTEFFRFIVDKMSGQIKTKTVFESKSPSYRTLKFVTYDSIPFPTVKAFNEADLIINSDILKEGLAKIMHCINPGEIRIAMSGAYIMIDNDKMTFVGTDGVKLSESIMTINGDISGKDVVLKYDFANSLRSILDLNSQVFMFFEDRTAYVSCNDTYIVGTLIVNESYPNYKAVLSSYDKVITVPRYDFTDSVTAITDVLDPEDNYRLSLTLKGNTLNLKNDKVDVSHEFENSFDHELDVDVNGSFLLSLLNDMGGEDLDICFAEGKNTVIFKPHNMEGHTSLLSTVRRR